MTTDTGTILALDVGGARIGLALASNAARLARPHGALANDEQVFDRLRALCKAEGVSQLVVGLPRGMRGQVTAQTTTVEAFADKLASELGLPIAWQDETLTSVHAEAELQTRGKAYRKEDIDALAATYILEDYLDGNV